MPLPAHTTRHGNKFRVRLLVPHKLRAIMGRATVYETLNTDSLIEAKRLQPAAVARLRAILDAADRGPIAIRDPLTGEALWLKDWNAAPLAETMTENTAMRKKLVGDLTPPSAIPPDKVKSEILDTRVREVAKSHGATRAEEYRQIAHGKGTPLALHLDTWLSQSGFSNRTAQKRRQAIETFARWLKAKNRPALFEAVDRKVAYEFRDEELAKRHPETANSLLGGLRAYWAWCIDRQKIEGDNNWQAVKSIPKVARAKSDRQRGFRDDELKAIFARHENRTAERLRQQLLPLMALAYASGARLGELAALRVRDVLSGDALRDKCHDLEIRECPCPHGALFIRYDEDTGKTANAERLTPVHPVIAGVVAGLIKGKKPDDLLFTDDRHKRRGSKGRPASFALTQRFERYRKMIGVHDRENERERSRVTFHSFRHTFISAAMRALADGGQSFNAYTVADVVGHSKKGMALPMTAENYAEPSSLKSRMACVESVRLVDSASERREAV